MEVLPATNHQQLLQEFRVYLTISLLKLVTSSSDSINTITETMESYIA